MLKRLIALIGALVLVFTLTLPCFAEEQYDYNDCFDYTYTFGLSNKPNFLVLSLLGDIKVTISDGSESSSYYFEQLLFCTDDFGNLDVFTTGVDTFGEFLFYRVFDSTGSHFYFYDSVWNVIDYFQYSTKMVYFSYNSEDVLYVLDNLHTYWGFSCENNRLTQDDLDAARQEGYEEGRDVGVAEGYNQGFDEGYYFGYDEGLADGKEFIDQDAVRQEGYRTGYDAALKDLEKISIPFFEYCTFSAVVHGITADTGVEYTHTINFVPSVNYSIVSFDSAFVEIQKYITSNGASWDYVNSVEINMTWEDDFVFDFSIFPLYAIGDYQINSSSIFTPGGFAFNLKLGDLDSEGKRKFELSDFQFGVTVKQIKIAIDNPEDSLLSFELFVPDQFYNDGYINGYSAGFTKGASVDSSSAFNEGYENGYTSGYLIGKEEGLVLVRQGDWKQLFLAVVEAPVNTFQSLFNFEVLGLDMRAAFGSILAICVILIIVKKVIL